MCCSRSRRDRKQHGRCADVLGADPKRGRDELDLEARAFAMERRTPPGFSVGKKNYIRASTHMGGERLESVGGMEPRCRGG